MSELTFDTPEQCLADFNRKIKTVKGFNKTQIGQRTLFCSRCERYKYPDKRCNLFHDEAPTDEPQPQEDAAPPVEPVVTKADKKKQTGYSCVFCGGTGKWNVEGDVCEACEGRGYYCSPPFGAPPIMDVLDRDDVEALAEYWCNNERGETLGQFIQRVAMRAIEKWVDEHGYDGEA